MVKEKLSVFGLGKLGSTMLACFAQKGWNVIGVDVLQDSVDKINKSKSPVQEPLVEDMIRLNKNRIEATTDVEYAIINSDVSFIIVPTPSKKDGLFSTEYIEKAANDIATVLKKKNSYHLIVITSTVLLGDTEKIANQIETISGKKLSKDFGVCYNPEFIALGRIVHDSYNPDIILIGESDEEAGSILEGIHKELVDNNPTIHRMNFYNAELTKIALNSYCTMKITYANSIAELCENIPGGDSEKVLKAIGSDSRVGNKYFKGGLAYSGCCFPRDARALSSTAKRYGINNLYCSTTDRIDNYHKTERIYKLIINLLKEKDTNQIAILGLSYKEDTPVIEESVSISVIKMLHDEGYDITVYDPMAMPTTIKELKDYIRIKYADTAYSCIENKSVCFIATPWPQFKQLNPEEIVRIMKNNPIILDAWGILPFNGDKGIDVRKIGKSKK